MLWRGLPALTTDVVMTVPANALIFVVVSVTVRALPLLVEALRDVRLDLAVRVHLDADGRSEGWAHLGQVHFAI